MVVLFFVAFLVLLSIHVIASATSIYLGLKDSDTQLVLHTLRENCKLLPIAVGLYLAAQMELSGLANVVIRLMTGS